MAASAAHGLEAAFHEEQMLAQHAGGAQGQSRERTAGWPLRLAALPDSRPRLFRKRPQRHSTTRTTASSARVLWSGGTRTRALV